MSRLQGIAAGSGARFHRSGESAAVRAEPRRGYPPGAVCAARGPG